MSDSQQDFALRLKSCVKGMLWLVLVAALLFAGVSSWALAQHGAMGVAAAAVSTLLCLLSACGALLVTGLSIGTPNAMNGMFLGVFLRTLVPLVLSFLLTQVSSPLADAGLFAMVLINFLVMLTAETLVVVRMIQTHTTTVF